MPKKSPCKRKPMTEEEKSKMLMDAYKMLNSKGMLMERAKSFEKLIWETFHPTTKSRYSTKQSNPLFMPRKSTPETPPSSFFDALSLAIAGKTGFTEQQLDRKLRTKNDAEIVDIFNSALEIIQSGFKLAREYAHKKFEGREFLVCAHFPIARGGEFYTITFTPTLIPPRSIYSMNSLFLGINELHKKARINFGGYTKQINESEREEVLNNPDLCADVFLELANAKEVEYSTKKRPRAGQCFYTAISEDGIDYVVRGRRTVNRFALYIGDDILEENDHDRTFKF